ncbi:jg3088 [Pararge aegeria aegeria]|uniref:Jg3088 protein n=1 Tax=Pararge aegeria aegeria TaxID=348720 RepID=A0A8S4QND4_9NEOP|nr:jg3088 [Pararge aegeria aegeria]
MGRAHSSEKGTTLGSQGAGMAAPNCTLEKLHKPDGGYQLTTTLEIDEIRLTHGLKPLVRMFPCVKRLKLTDFA